MEDLEKAMEHIAKVAYEQAAAAAGGAPGGAAGGAAPGGEAESTDDDGVIDAEFEEAN